MQNTDWTARIAKSMRVAKTTAAEGRNEGLVEVAIFSLAGLAVSLFVLSIGFADVSLALMQ